MIPELFIGIKLLPDIGDVDYSSQKLPISQE